MAARSLEPENTQVKLLALPVLTGTADQLLLTVIVVAVVILVLGLVALIRCYRKDIPEVIRAFASWWRK